MSFIPTDFPLNITTHPVFIGFAYMSQLFTLLIGIGILVVTRKSWSLEGTEQIIEKRGQSPSYSEDLNRWRTRLKAFTNQDDTAILKETITAWQLLQSPFALLASSVMVFLSLLNLLVFTFTHNAIFANLPWLFLLGTFFPLSMLLIQISTYGIGFRRVKRLMKNSITYADLNERHVSDYRSHVFRWLLGLLVIANGLLLLFLPSLPGGSGLSPLTPALWIRVSILLGTVIAVVLGEFCLVRIVALPRLVVTSDPVKSQHADDLLRTITINNVYKGVVGCLRNYLLLQWFFFFLWLLSSPILLAGQIFVTALYLLCWTPTALKNSRDEKYLGGKKTGWPWRKAAVAG